MPVGRPPHFKTPEELQEKLDEIQAKYLNKGYCLNDTLFAHELGFSSTSSFTDYINRSDEFSYTIKRAKLYNEGLKQAKAENGEINATVFVFDKKCNSGWNDKQAEQNDNDIDVIDFDFEEVK